LVQRAALSASVIVASHDAAILAISSNRIQLGMPAGQRLRAAAVETTSLAPAADATPELGSRTAQHPLAALAAFVRPALRRYVGAAVLGTLASAFAIALTTVSAWLIVRASESPAIMYLLVAIVGVRFFGLGRAALRYSERLVTHDAVLSSATELRARLWRSLASLGTGSRRLQRGGTALDYLVGATDDIRDLVPRIVVPVAVGVSVGLAALLTAWLVLPVAAGVLFVVLIACIVLAPAIALASDRAAEGAQQEARGGVLRRFAAMLDAADDLRGNGVDAPIRSQLRQSDRAIGALGRRVAASRGLGAALVVLAGCFGAVGMLVVGAQAVAAGVIPVELAAVLVLLPVALIEPFTALVSAVQHWPALVAALRRAGGLLATPATPSGTLALPVRVGELRLESLSARWPGATREAFGGATASVRPGQWLVVEGPSGSGKSTLLTALLGGIHPSGGRLLFDELAVGELDPADLRRHVAWCPQDAHLFDSTLRGNLLLGRARDDAPTEAELHEAMRAAGLGRVLASLPLGLDTRIGSQGSHFSGGERQRIAVARTLLSRADIVLLDEPTAHLDEVAATALMNDLRTAFSDRIVVLVTHHTEELEPGDELLVLGEHRIEELSPAFA
jgi:ATP-binding cassette subfamily C protein CydCD